MKCVIGISREGGSFGDSDIKVPSDSVEKYQLQVKFNLTDGRATGTD
jgi:hypothetical protein